MTLPTYTLQVPVEVRDGDGNVIKTITAVTFRRIKGKDLNVLDAAKGAQAKIRRLIGAVCGLLPSEVDDMDAADVFQLGEMVTDFLGLSPKTGET